MKASSQQEKVKPSSQEKIQTSSQDKAKSSKAPKSEPKSDEKVIKLYILLFKFISLGIKP